MFFRGNSCQCLFQDRIQLWPILAGGEGIVAEIAGFCGNAQVSDPIALQVPAGGGQIGYHGIHITEGDSHEPGPEISYRLQLKVRIVIVNQVLPDITGHHPNLPVHEVMQVNTACSILIDNNDPGKLDMGPGKRHSFSALRGF